MKQHKIEIDADVLQRHILAGLPVVVLPFGVLPTDRDPCRRQSIRLFISRSLLRQGCIFISRNESMTKLLRQILALFPHRILVILSCKERDDMAALTVENFGVAIVSVSPR